MNKDFVAANKGCNLLNDPLSLSRLYEAAESAKIELSKGQSTTINLPFITADATGPKVYTMLNTVSDCCLAQAICTRQCKTRVVVVTDMTDYNSQCDCKRATTSDIRCYMRLLCIAVTL
eukprot:4442-Heterococcus_DN1.PRE.3